MDSYREGKENYSDMNRGKGIGLVKVGRIILTSILKKQHFMVTIYRIIN
jgi:hypothetical protein